MPGKNSQSGWVTPKLSGLPFLPLYYWSSWRIWWQSTRWLQFDDCTIHPKPISEFKGEPGWDFAQSRTSKFSGGSLSFGNAFVRMFQLCGHHHYGITTGACRFSRSPLLQLGLHGISDATLHSVELYHTAVPGIGQSSCVGPGTVVLQLSANGCLFTHYAEDHSGSSTHQPSACQSTYDHGVWDVPVCVPWVLGLCVTLRIKTGMSPKWLQQSVDVPEDRQVFENLGSKFTKWLRTKILKS